MKLSRRRFMQGSAILLTGAALPVSSTVLMGSSSFVEAGTSAPAIVSNLKPSLLFEFETRAFDRAMYKAALWGQRAASMDDWYVRVGDKVWAASVLYKSPLDGRTVSPLPTVFSFSAMNVLQTEDRSVWKNRDGKSFNEILSSAPREVLQLTPFS